MFAAVGLAPCGLSTASAPVGTTFSIPFSVFDDGSPPLQSTVNRTVLVISPCLPGQRATLVALQLSTLLEQLNTYCTSCISIASPKSLCELCVSTVPM